MGRGRGAVEGLDMTFWSGRKVLITGHTGFKGSWLSLWLLSRGADVHGLALEPDTRPALFSQLGLAREMGHHVVDVRDEAGVGAVVREVKPEIVFHMAAQPLVLRSYREPVETWATNVMGTINLLQALRALGRPASVVVITTDKVYENREWEFSYRENDTLGGHDPYSASKAATELAVSSWRRAFGADEQPLRLATARAGNVIGGGDWAENRIVPDLVRALRAGEPLLVRNPHAVRPWQHVLDPLAGYLRLARRLHEGDDDCADAFNFGPLQGGARPVRVLIEEALRHWPDNAGWRDVSGGARPHEAGLLSLAVDRATSRLGWFPRWGFEESVRMTMRWYRQVGQEHGTAARELSLEQIGAHEESGTPR